MIVTLAICVVVFILGPGLAACCTSMVDGRCNIPTALEPQKLELCLVGSKRHAGHDGCRTGCGADIQYTVHR